MLPTAKTKLYFKLLIAALFLGLAYVLNRVFSGQLILPQQFKAGPIVIHYYGVIMALAVLSGFYLAMKRAPKFGISRENAEDIVFWLAIAGFASARLYHVLSSFGYYLQYPGDIIKVWNGGLSIYGAVMGGLVVVWVLAKRYTLQAANLLDWLAPSLILGQIIGRFGNFFNYEAFGYPTNLPWKMFVPQNFRPSGYWQYNFFHPFFLYEALGSLAILLILFKLEKFFDSKKEARPKPEIIQHNPLKTSGTKAAYGSSGKLFFSYLLLYNSLRFCLEFLRIDSVIINGIRVNACVSLALAFLGAISIFVISRFAKMSEI